MKKLLSQLGTVGIATVVTVLVWLYAEDANITEYTDQAVQIRFVMPDELDAEITPRETISLQVDFQGSTGQYQQFVELMREGTIELDPPLTFEQDRDATVIDTRSILEERIPQIRNLGINITAVRPTTITVGYEKRIDLTLPIGPIEVPNGIELAQPPRVVDTEPSEVTIRGLPAGRRDALTRVRAEILLRPEDLQGLDPGVEEQVQLPVVLSPSVEGVVPTPPSIKVWVKRADDRGTITIDRRPILLSYPSSINERYVVSIEESARFITSFELEGPRNQIDLLREDPSTGAVWASVRLTNEEADAAVANGGEITKQVDVLAPQGVVLSSDVVRVTVRVALREARETPEP